MRVNTTKTCIVVIPAHNEESSIAQVIGKVPRWVEDVQVRILIVNDGSTDQTEMMAARAGADYVYSYEQNRGLGAVIYFGLKQAYALGADIAVMIDADDEYPADEIPAVIEPIVNGHADYVLGSRFLRPVRGMKLYRRLGNYCFSWLQTVLLLQRIIDGQTGFRAFNRQALRDLDIIHDYNYAQVLTLNLVRQGYRMQEVPISYQTRTAGDSFIRWYYAFKVLPAIWREMITSPQDRAHGQSPIPLLFHKSI
ncbi:MAG: glycosyltransferase family 2 protein [Paenibacillaceae bacterium]